MRFSCQLSGFVAAAVFLLCTATAGTVFQLAPAQYAVNADTGFCDGFNCSTSYSNGFFSAQPTTLTVGCTADAGSPICGAAMVSDVPFISVWATTQTSHVEEDGSASGNVVYTYQVLCDACPTGTIVPLGVSGSVGMNFTPGSVGGTVTININGGAFVNGYDPLTSSDNVVVDNVTVNNLVGGGICENTWSGFAVCSPGPSNSFGTPFEARVGTVYTIGMVASVLVKEENRLIFPGATPGQAQAFVDPVISFAPGFDSTGYSLAVSPGMGNQASTVPEPATWMLLSTAALGWGCSRRLRRQIAGKWYRYEIRTSTPKKSTSRAIFSLLRRM